MVSIKTMGFGIFISGLPCMARLLTFALIVLPVASPLAGGFVETRLGKPGDPAKVDRTIEVGVSDEMRYFPDEFRVKRGQTIRFQIVNGGALRHMMVLGKLAELERQAKRMSQSPGQSMDGPAAISVEPGQTGNLVWQFSHAGTFDFACLVPGHLMGGMRGKVIVRP